MKSSTKERVQKFLDSSVVHKTIFALLCLDLVIMFIETLVDFLPPETRHSPACVIFEQVAWTLTICIISIFAVEIALRIIVRPAWLKRPLHLFDLLIVVGSLVILSVFNVYDAHHLHSSKAAGLLLLARSWRILRVVETSINLTSKGMEKRIHELMEENARLRKELNRVSSASRSIV